jgi:hypothetical protein
MMSRVARSSLMLAAAVSIVVLAAVCVLWTLSYSTPVRLAGFGAGEPRGNVREAVYVWATGGRAVVVRTEYLLRDGHARPEPEGSNRRTLLLPQTPGVLGRAGFSTFAYTATRTGLKTSMWTVPAWAFALAAGIAPAAAALRMRRRKPNLAADDDA